MRTPRGIIPPYGDRDEKKMIRVGIHTDTDGDGKIFSP